MVTNSIQDLEPGHGNYNFLLNAQGRIQADATIFAEPDSLPLETNLSSIPRLIALLDHFIIMDDVELADISATRSGLGIAGPLSPALLNQLLLPTADLAELQMKTIPWRSASVTLLHAYSPFVPRFELWSEHGTIASLAAELHSAGAVPCEPASLEYLRLLEGTPRFGTDIRDRELPQETAHHGTQSRALHFSKGCYLGQEIVERIRSRGNVHRTFSAFRLEGSLPTPGTILESNSEAHSEAKPVGELTSVAAIPLPNNSVQLALGYVRREAIDRNLPLSYPGGQAIPVNSPFNIAAAG
jgi:folate-binding protein YgfZ